MMSEEKQVWTSQNTIQIGQNLPSCNKNHFEQQGKQISPTSQNMGKEDRFREIYHQKSQPIQTDSLGVGKKAEEWTLLQENLLFELHNRKGNKWVQIARQLKKNDNSVKNHYHSKLRKTLRKLNQCISEHLQGQIKPLKNNIISKIVQTAQGIYQNREGQQKQLPLKAYALKNKLLNYSELNQQQICLQQQSRIKKLITELLEFQNQLRASLRPKGKVKSGSNKYKGKQILSLLNQNRKLQTVQPRAKTPTNSLHPSHQQSDNHRELAQQQQKNPLHQSSSLQTAQSKDIKQSNFCSSFTLYNPQNVQPVQSFFYPLYQQPNFVIPSFPFLGHHSELFRFGFNGFN